MQIKYLSENGRSRFLGMRCEAPHTQKPELLKNFRIGSKSNSMAIFQEVNMEFHESRCRNIYQIKIKENLDTATTNWFGDLTLIPLENGGTLLVGPFSDQSALRGFLDQLWNLNFTVVSVENTENGNHQNSNTGGEARPPGG